MDKCIYLFTWLGVGAVIFLTSCSSAVSLKKADSVGSGTETALRSKSNQVRTAAFANVPAVAELCSWSPSSSSASESEVDCRRGCKPADILNGKANSRVPDLKFPVPNGTLSSSFGYRRGIFHSGLDVTASLGDDVLACAAGRVVCAGTRKGFRRYGQTVLVDHGRNVFTQYSHLSKILVKAGQEVKQGQVIAEIGSTGRSSSPHLHLEVRVDDRVYDPYVQFSPSQLRGVEMAKNFSGTPVGPVTFRRLSSRP
jgi:murein DD-endopeptidase MepM/ murein hydrolase activator NlpD